MSKAPTALPRCPERLSDDQIATFRDQGYLAFADLLSPAEVEHARTRLDELVREAAADPAFVLGANGALHRPGARYHVQFEPGLKLAGLHEPGLELKVRKLMWYCDIDPFFAALNTRHPRLRMILDALLGPGALPFQDMALVKPPRIGSEKPWHQDNAYFAVTPLDQVVGLWIALDQATPANGCMHVIPGGHRLGPLRHHHDRDCEIVLDRLDLRQAVPVPLPPGGALIFMGMLPHQTPPNRSAQRRRALQLHYRGATSALVPREEYDAVFAEADGSPASCVASHARRQAQG
jgi:hypothetical protein